MNRALVRAGTVLAATVAVVATLLLFPADAADDEFVQGSGRASASVLRIGPSTGRLSLAPQVGVALADYTGTIGRGESRLFDYAALDDSIPEELKSEFPPVRVTSSDDGAAKGEERTIGGAGSGSVDAGASVQRASATDAPVGRSAYELASVVVPGLIELAGVEAASHAGVFDDRTREASGVTTIDNVTIGGGRVVLRGLRWDATQRTGDGEAASGSFSIGSASIAGQPVPVPAGDLGPLAAAMNAALAPTGLVVDLPRATTSNGLVQVSPLAVRIVDSALGRQLLAPVVAGAQPVRDPVAQFIFENISEASSLVLVGDVGLGIVTGAGRLDLELGGTAAFTEGEFFESPFQFDFGGGEGGSFDFGADSGGDFGSIADGPGLATTGDPAAVPGAVASPDGRGGAVAAAPARTRTVGGQRGGVAAGVGGVGLLTALGVALADYRAMRGSRRIVPTT